MDGFGSPDGLFRRVCRVSCGPSTNVAPRGIAIGGGARRGACSGSMGWIVNVPVPDIPASSRPFLRPRADWVFTPLASEHGILDQTAIFIPIPLPSCR